MKTRTRIRHIALSVGAMLVAYFAVFGFLAAFGITSFIPLPLIAAGFTFGWMISNKENW